MPKVAVRWKSPARARIERAFDRFIVTAVVSHETGNTTLRISGMQGKGRLALGGLAYDVAWRVGNPEPEHEHFSDALLADGLELRGWLPGDRIRLDYGTKKLKKLFAEQRIAASARGLIPVLTDAQGRILWIRGIARSVDAALPSTNVLNIMVKHGLG
jgi:tRNA(Ile)-lysidine synthase